MNFFLHRGSGDTRPAQTCANNIHNESAYIVKGVLMEKNTH